MKPDEQDFNLYALQTLFLICRDELKDIERAKKIKNIVQNYDQMLAQSMEQELRSPTPQIPEELAEDSTPKIPKKDD